MNIITFTLLIPTLFIVVLEAHILGCPESVYMSTHIYHINIWLLKVKIKPDWPNIQINGQG
jgi:hypothetical protein